MKCIYITFLTLTLCLANVKNGANQIFRNIQNNQISSGDDISSDFIDLLYLKLLTQPYIQNEKSSEYLYQYKMILTKASTIDIDKFKVGWIEMTSGSNYANSIPWQSNFQDQMLYLLNDSWSIYQIIPHISNEKFEQKIYIFNRVIKK